MYYFAYGSNMDESRMKNRGVDFLSREFAILKGYKLLFNKKATAGNFSFANIEVDENNIVEGILYKVSAEGMTKLDKHEGYPNNYYKTNVEVIKGNESVSAIVYIANDDKIVEGLLPKKEYLSHILKGKDLLSAAYFQRLLNIKTLD